MVMEEKYKGVKPLVFLEEQLVCYSKGFLCVCENGKFHSLNKLQETSWLERIRLLRRLFRREPKHAKAISKDQIIVAMNKHLFIVNTVDGLMNKVFTAREGFSDPLNICTECKPWIALWGDYGSNPDKTEVNIYGLTENLKTEILYTFPPNRIRHIHNIIPRLRGGFYILTGDTEATAGIYMAESDFKCVKEVKLGSQQFRAVVAFDTENGLLYATDSVNEPNHIYLLKENGEITRICSLKGSCIYGTSCDNDYYFSTTVEPDESKKGILSWFTYKRGKGILSNHVTLVRVDAYYNSEEVLDLDKDIFPMKLFQYGSIQFPSGCTNDLWIYPTAVKKFDGFAIRMENHC